MMIFISILLVCTAVRSHDPTPHHQHRVLRTSEHQRRTGYTIHHGDAQSSVNVNLHSNSNFQPSQEAGTVPKQVSTVYYQQPITRQEGVIQYQQAKPSYLTDLATKQYLNINPVNAKAQQQLYNVGYSINIENSAPKSTYRLPVQMSKNAQSYRQQKLLNADVVTGSHKDKVEKPINYEFSASNTHSGNYIPLDQSKQQYTPSYGEKQALTKIFADVKNTHGYTWKTLSPGVEISGYHSLDDMTNKAQSFDHAAALGRSQGFDISNVVGNSKNPYQQKTEQAYNYNKVLSQADSADASTINNAHGVDTTQYTQNSYPLHNFESSQNIDFKNFGHDFNSAGGSIEVDKSLLEGFYKNYNPIFYQPEVTLPSPGIPKQLHINLHGAASQQAPLYNYKESNYQVPSNQDSQYMIDQHYAFVQASEMDHQPSADVKPVQELQEDSNGQHSQQNIAVQKPAISKEEKISGHKKYAPSFQIPSYRQYGPRSVVYYNDKNHRLKTDLRPPPLYVMHQKY